jgi:hypothetical protein
MRDMIIGVSVRGVPEHSASILAHIGHLVNG